MNARGLSEKNIPQQVTFVSPYRTSWDHSTVRCLLAKHNICGTSSTEISKISSLDFVISFCLFASSFRFDISFRYFVESS